MITHSSYSSLLVAVKGTTNSAKDLLEGVINERREQERGIDMMRLRQRHSIEGD